MALESLHFLDILIMISGGLLVLGTALLSSSRTSSKGCANAESAKQDFFLANRSVSWWVVGASLLAANIGTEHFVGQAGTACSSGLAVALYEWLASYLLFLLGFVFGPVYLKEGIATIPEWFETRFNTSCRVLLAVISLLGAVVTKISASLFAGALLCEVVLGINFWVSLPFILILTGFYSAIGGLRAVVITDVMQALIFTIGGAVGAIYAVDAVGGWARMVDDFKKFHLDDFPHVIRPYSSEFSWTGMFFGQMIGSVWYWCIDQEMSQRILCASSIRQAKGGAIFAGFLKILPPFIIAFPGMAARLMYERCKASNASEFPLWCDEKQPGDSAYLFLITRTFPSGVVGLVLISMVVSMMSALSAVFNSASAIFTLDVYLRFINPKASAKQVLRVGQAFILFLVACSFAWLFAIRAQSNGVFLITQSVATHISPPLAVVAILGIVFPWISGMGGLSGIVLGIVAGLAQYFPSLMYQSTCLASAENTISEKGWWIWFVCLQFNHFASILGIFTALVTCLVSLVYPRSLELQNLYTLPEKSLVMEKQQVKLSYDDMEWKRRGVKSMDNLLLFAGIVMMICVTIFIIIFR